MNDAPGTLLWLRSWERVGTSWMIRAAFLRDGDIVDELVPPETLNAPRAYDLASPALAGTTSESLGVDIDDVASLSPLVDPSDVLGKLHPRLRESRHDIYMCHAGETPIYIPAALLIRALWLWSDWLVPALLTPNSLALYLNHSKAEGGEELVRLSGGLSTWLWTETHMRRVAWLGRDADARDSWGSVLSRAYQGRLSLKLPHARLSTWVWGQRVAGGVLACELVTPNVDFYVPDKRVFIRMGSKVKPCPPAPPFRYRTHEFMSGIWPSPLADDDEPATSEKSWSEDEP